MQQTLADLLNLLPARLAAEIILLTTVHTVHAVMAIKETTTAAA